MLNWRLSSFYFVYFCTLGVVVPYWSLFLKGKGFNAIQIGELMAIIVLTKVVAPNIWASIADHLVHKKGRSLGILKFATVMALLFFISIYWADSYWFMAFSMLGFCMFWNACLPQIEAATLNFLKEDKHRYGNIRLWGSVSFILMALLLGVLIDKFGPNMVLPAGTGALILLVIASYFLLNNLQTNQADAVSESNAASESKALSQSKAISQSQGDSQSKETESTNLNNASPKNILHCFNYSVIVIFVLCFFMQLSHAPFYTFFSIYLEGHEYTKTQIGWLWSLGVIAEIGVFLIAYRLLNNFKLSTLFKLTLLVAGVRWLIVAKWPDYAWLVVLSQLMHGVTYGLYHSVMVQFIDHFFKGRFQIRGQALYGSLTFGLGGSIGSVVSGHVWQGANGNSLFYAVGILMLVTTIAAQILLSRMKI